MILKQLFFALIVKPLVVFICGVHIRGRENLPYDTPCILVANHNSHIDTLILMSLFPLKHVGRLRPVAARDYFMKNQWIQWFSTHIIGILALERNVKKSYHTHPLEALAKALDKGESLIIFPEGSRGRAEQLESFKTGVAHLAKMAPLVPVIPIYISGAGKILPKGESLLVPFLVDIFIEKPMFIHNETCQNFTQQLQQCIQDLHTKNQL